MKAVVDLSEKEIQKLNELVDMDIQSEEEAVDAIHLVIEYA